MNQEEKREGGGGGEEPGAAEEERKVTVEDVGVNQGVVEAEADLVGAGC